MQHPTSKYVATYTVVLFHTDDSIYNTSARRLIESLHTHNLPYTEVLIANTGKWVRNAGQKPIVLADQLRRLHSNIVYLDADAEVLAPPTLFDTFDEDIGSYYDTAKKELLSGTMYLKNNARTHALIDKWVVEQMRSPEVWDQKILQRILTAMNRNESLSDFLSADLSLRILPEAYCHIIGRAENENPVILHHQASRVAKRRQYMLQPQVNDKGTPIACDVPKYIGGVTTRHHVDGSFSLPRATPEIIRELSRDYARDGMKLRWYPKEVDILTFEPLRPQFSGKGAYLIGKGPSLDNLRAEHFRNPDWPIMAINEAIHKVEELDVPNPVFCVQQDQRLLDTCLPKRGTLFVSTSAYTAYKDFDRKYLFIPAQIKAHSSTLSVLCAMKICKILGTVAFEMLCFDAAVKGDVEYANCVGYKSNNIGPASRFLLHRKRIDMEAGKLPIVYILPTP